MLTILVQMWVVRNDLSITSFEVLCLVGSEVGRWLFSAWWYERIVCAEMSFVNLLVGWNVKTRIRGSCDRLVKKRIAVQERFVRSMRDHKESLKQRTVRLLR